jgi:hypothetical protein
MDTDEHGFSLTRISRINTNSKSIFTFQKIRENWRNSRQSFFVRVHPWLKTFAFTAPRLCFEK